MTKKLRVTIGVFVVLCVATIGAGAAFEAWSRHVVKQRFPPQGKMVDIGGRQLFSGGQINIASNVAPPREYFFSVRRDFPKGRGWRGSCECYVDSSMPL